MYMYKYTWCSFNHYYLKYNIVHVHNDRLNLQTSIQIVVVLLEALSTELRLEAELGHDGCED